MKSSNLIPELIKRLALENKSPCTIRHYTESVRRFLMWCDKNTREDICVYVQDWILDLRWKEKLSPSSINLHTNAVRYYCNFILRNPVPLDIVPRMKERKELPEPMTIQEVQKIFAMENNRKHLALLQVSYYGGLRLGDIQRLKIADLRFERGLIHICDGKGMKDRFVMLPDCIHGILKNVIAGRPETDPVFISQWDGQSYPKRTIQRIFENACARAGIPGRHNIHRLRHSYGTHMVQHGVNLRVIQETMGHSSPNTTARYTKIAAQSISEMRNILAT